MPSPRERPTSPAALDEAERRAEDPALRPRTLDEVLGQAHVVDNLRITIRAAKARGEAMDHTLLHGPPGLGKTSLAHVIAEELGTDVRVTAGPLIQRGGDLAALLVALNPREVLFIDEIHRLPRAVEEVLYAAMEDFRIDILMGQGPGAQSVSMPLPRFTLVGATTRKGLLSAPLRDRFPIQLQFDLYDPETLALILTRSAARLGVQLAADGARSLARRSRGTPRVANRLLRRARDFAEVESDGRITPAVVDRTLSQLQIDDEGLDLLDRRLLETLQLKFGGGPVGLSTLATALGEERDVIEDVCEPFLIHKGFLARTPRGRIVTESGVRHLGFPGAAAGGGAP